jgi:hypothetical protein
MWTPYWTADDGDGAGAPVEYTAYHCRYVEIKVGVMEGWWDGDGDAVFDRPGPKASQPLTICFEG